MKKKIFALALVCMLAIVSCSGITLSYFTDTQSAKNTFAVGSVKVWLLEASVDRKNSETGEMLSDNDIINSAKDYHNYLGSGIILANQKYNKMPYLKNTGNVSAYVRVRVLMPTGLSTDSKFYLVHGDVVSPSNPDAEWSVRVDRDHTVTVNGKEYTEYYYTRKQPLAPREMTQRPPLASIGLKPGVDETWRTNAITNGWLDENGKFDILVYGDSIQQAGFSSAYSAFANFNNVY